MLTRCRLAIKEGGAVIGEYKEALTKRCDELRHYLNVIVTSSKKDPEDTQEQASPQVVADQVFYKRISKFTGLCNQSFREDFSKLTSQ